MYVYHPSRCITQAEEKKKNAMIPHHRSGRRKGDGANLSKLPHSKRSNQVATSQARKFNVEVNYDAGDIVVTLWKEPSHYLSG